MRVKYSTTSPTQDEFDSLPRLALRLSNGHQSVSALGLVDSGATVSVLPYELGVRLGGVWDDRYANLRLTGNLGHQPAMPFFAEAEIVTLLQSGLRLPGSKARTRRLYLDRLTSSWSLKFASTAHSSNSR